MGVLEFCVQRKKSCKTLYLGIFNEVITKHWANHYLMSMSPVAFGWRESVFRPVYTKHEQFYNFIVTCTVSPAGSSHIGFCTRHDPAFTAYCGLWFLNFCGNHYVKFIHVTAANAWTKSLPSFNILSVDNVNVCCSTSWSVILY